jgi:hypothetical protein
VAFLWFFKQGEQYAEGPDRSSFVIDECDPKEWKEGRFEVEYAESEKFPLADLHHVALRISLCEPGVPGVLKGEATLDIDDVKVEVVE